MHTHTHTCTDTHARTHTQTHTHTHTRTHCSCTLSHLSHFLHCQSLSHTVTCVESAQYTHCQPKTLSKLHCHTYIVTLTLICYCPPSHPDTVARRHWYVGIYVSCASCHMHICTKASLSHCHTVTSHCHTVTLLYRAAFCFGLAL